MKKINYFHYLAGLCLLFWITLFIDHSFLQQSTDKISKFVAQIEFVLHFLIIFSGLIIYKNSSHLNRKMLLWFLIINIGLFFNDISFYFITYFNSTNKSYHPSVPFLDLVPFYIWVFASVIFLLKILRNYILQNQNLIKMISTIIVINIVMLFLFLSSIHYSKNVFSYSTLSHILTTVSQLIVLDFAVLNLMYAESIGFIIFLSGIITLISGDFFLDYAIVAKSSILSFYGELFWFLGLLLNWFGTLLIQQDRNYEIKFWIRKENTIKSKLAFWYFSMAIISFLFFFIIAYTFSIINKTVFLGLPVFIMIYSVIVVILSMYIGKYFEEPFKKIENNIRFLMLDNKTQHVDNNFFMEEFVFLQNFILEAFKRKEESKILELENDALQISTNEQEKFKTAVGKMMHDITSPIASINTIISKLGSQIPENDRITLRHASDRIEGISQRLLNQFKQNDVDDEPENMLISLSLFEILNEKKEEHLKSGIHFYTDIDDNARFSFIKHNIGIFKRMISNLINNAVDALKDKSDAKIKITLASNAGSTILIIEDNGIGMPQHIISKFEQGISVTEGKENGHGIGLTQVRDAIKFGNGECKIYSSKEYGTRITIYFPEISIPQWIATEIKLTRNDTIIILDDDESIHGAWENKFETTITKIPTLAIKHYIFGKDVIAYFNSLTPEQKQNTYLLADYELLAQDTNGLEIIKQLSMQRATLVTSYATQKKIQEQIINLGIKMLPKELVSAVKIVIDKMLVKGSKVVDMVWVEDQKWFVDSLVKKFYSHLKVDVYYDPISFMEEVIQYPLDTRIILDTYFEDENEDPYMQTGFSLAKELHAMGFTKLILFCGENPRGQVPEYLQIASKSESYLTENLDKI